jgi:signal-transduction protein with cAMP-binding, CBS, and nucleotidyltransferase domain
MNYVKSLRDTDLAKLGRLNIFSWLSPLEVKALGSSLKMQNFQRNEVIFRESTVVPDAHVLVSGIARVNPRIPDLAD